MIGVSLVLFFFSCPQAFIQLRITNYELRVTNYLLSVVDCQLSVCLLLTANYPLLIKQVVPAAADVFFLFLRQFFEGRRTPPRPSPEGEGENISPPFLKEGCPEYSGRGGCASRQGCHVGRGGACPAPWEGGIMFLPGLLPPETRGRNDMGRGGAGVGYRESNYELRITNYEMRNENE